MSLDPLSYNQSLGITLPIIRALTHLQNYLQPPFQLLVTKGSTTLQASPNSTKTTSATLTRVLAFFLAFMFQQFSLFRIIFLLFFREHLERTPEYLVEILENFLVLCLTTIAFLCEIAFIKNKKQTGCVLTQRFKVLCPQKSDTSHRNNLKAEGLTYTAIVSFSAFPLLVLVAPQALPYDPLQFALNNYYAHSDWPKTRALKFLYGAIYFIPTSYFSALIFFILGLISAFLEGIQLLSKHICIWNNNFEKAEYQRKYHLFRVIQILLHQGNELASQCIFVFLGIGILITSTCGVATIKLRGLLPLAAYMACPIIVCVCLAINFFLFAIGDAPYTNVVKFRAIWLRWLRAELRSEYKRTVISCPQLGFHIGPMKSVGNHTALRVAQLIVDVTVNMLLLW